MTPDAIRWHFEQAVEIDRENSRAMGLSMTPGFDAVMQPGVASTAQLHAAGVLGSKKPNAPKLARRPIKTKGGTNGR